MSKHLERDLENLQQDVLAQAAAVEEATYGAIRALQQRAVGLAQQVIAGDDAIDRRQNRIEEECLKILALHQPVAQDLRRVAAVLAINTDLERRRTWPWTSPSGRCGWPSCRPCRCRRSCSA